MPLLFSENNDLVNVGLWNVSEDEKYFLDDIHLYNEEKEELEKLSVRKKIQWLSSRYLLHQLTQEEKRLITAKDNFGKPYLADSSLHISLSHSGDLAAAIVGTFPLGIDVQMKVEKLMRIRTKFLSEREIDEMDDYNDLELIHLYWGAKECLFKAYGKGEVDFKKHLFISKFNQEMQTITGNVNKNEVRLQYELKFNFIGDAVLVYTCSI